MHLLQWKQKNKNKLSLVLTIGVVLLQLGEQQRAQGVVLSWIYQLSLLFAQRKGVQVLLPTLKFTCDLEVSLASCRGAI